MGMMTRRNMKNRATKKVALSSKIKIEEKFVEFNYTKTEINRMSTAELKELATKQEIEDVENMTGAELKKVLINKFNL